MRRYEIRVDGEFSAAHQLRLYDGSMEPLHGHNWKIEVYVEADQLDSMGVVADFRLVQQALDGRLRRWHDSFLNEHPEFASRNPSTEHVAATLFDDLRPALPAGVRLRRVRVWETSRCAALVEETTE